jgi:hypothetical protein
MMNTKSGKLQVIILAAAVAMPWLFVAPVYAEQSVFVNTSGLIEAGEADFEAGYVLISDIPISWQSDVPWRITLSTAEPDFIANNNTGYIKSVADISWRSPDNEVWVPLDQNAQEISWGDETGSGVTYVDLLVSLDWLKDAPGEYHIDFVVSIEPL